jgi:uncharacterized protein
MSEAEEILASIRRIISEEGDGEEAASKPAAARPAPAPAPAPPPPPVAMDEVVVAEDFDEPEPPMAEPEDDVLELTEMVDDDGTLVDLGRPALDDDIDAALGDEPLLQPEPRRHHAQPDEGEFIISDHAAAAAAGSLAVLTTAAGRKIADQLGASDIGGVTVEELVRQLLRPMLRDWLDENLPPMVERLVRREIERLAAQGTGRR